MYTNPYVMYNTLVTITAFDRQSIDTNPVYTGWKVGIKGRTSIVDRDQSPVVPARSSVTVNYPFSVDNEPHLKAESSLFPNKAYGSIAAVLYL